MKLNESFDWGDIELHSLEINQNEEWMKLEKTLKQKRKKRFLMIFLWLGLGFTSIFYFNKLNNKKEMIVNSSLQNKNNLDINTKTLVVNENLNYIQSVGINDGKSETSPLNISKSTVQYSLIKANQISFKHKSSNLQESSDIEFKQNGELHQNVEWAICNTYLKMQKDLITPLESKSGSNIYNGEHINTIEKNLEISFITFINPSSIKSSNVDLSNTINPPLIYTTKKRYLINFIDFNLSYGLNTTNFYLNNKTSETFLQRNKNITEGFDSYQGEVLFGHQLNSNTSFSIGVNARIIHNITHESGSLETKELLKDQIIEINKKDGFIVQEIRGDIEGSFKRLYQTHFYNRFISISIPVVASRKIRLPLAALMNIETSIIFSLYNDVKGFLPSQSKSYRFEKTDDYVRHSRILDAFRIKISKDLQLSNNWHIHPFISYTSDLENRWKNTFISQKNSSIELGFTFKIKNNLIQMHRN
ncbi:MAG: hypothetical protein ABIO44_02635 [Saprospiraceae bacterium]